MCSTGDCNSLMGKLRYLYSQNVKTKHEDRSACSGDSLCSTGDCNSLMGKLRYLYSQNVKTKHEDTVCLLW